MDSEGRVRLAPAATSLPDTDAPLVWCLARDGKGALYAAPATTAGSAWTTASSPAFDAANWRSTRGLR